MNPKALSLVAEEEDPTAQETSDRRHVRKRAKGPASSKMTDSAAGPALSKKRTAPAGTNTSKAAKKCKTSAPVCQVRSDKNTVGAKVAKQTANAQCNSRESNIMKHDSNRRHRQGGELRSIRGFTQIAMETGIRKSR